MGVGRWLFVAILFVLAGCVDESGTLILPTVDPLATPLATLPSISTLTPTADIPTQTVEIPTATVEVVEVEVVETAVIVQLTVLETPTPTLAIPTMTPQPEPIRQQIIGQSVNGNNIVAHAIGTGNKNIVLVGGIHGGFEWNASLLTYSLLDHFQAAPEQVPNDVTLHIVPMMNPDGLVKATGFADRFIAADIIYDTVPGRFNANNVDLNRNWDCDWQPNAVWSTITVSGGSAPFSEPESQLMRDYFLTLQPELVVFYHSKAPGVFIGNCEGEPDPRVLTYASTYADASGYPFDRAGFTAYEITGDSTDYLSTVGIPAITVEMETVDQIEFSHNLSAVQSLLGLMQ